MSGTGAFLHGGRWSPRGRHVVYTAGSIALAMLEVLVHLDDAEAFRAKRHVYHAVTFDDATLSVLPVEYLPEGWNARPETNASRAVGDEWLDEAPGVVLGVPSVVVPGEFHDDLASMNYLVNPHHPDFEEVVTVGEVRPLDWDPRVAPVRSRGVPKSPRPWPERGGRVPRERRPSCGRSRPRR